MNADLQKRITAIKAECEKVIELDKLATAEPWEVNKYDDIIGDDELVAETFSASPPMKPSIVSNNNARFIAHARNVSPAMARVIVMAVRYAEDTDDKILLLGIAEQWEGK